MRLSREPPLLGWSGEWLGECCEWEGECGDRGASGGCDIVRCGGYPRDPSPPLPLLWYPPPPTDDDKPPPGMIHIQRSDTTGARGEELGSDERSPPLPGLVPILPYSRCGGYM